MNEKVKMTIKIILGLILIQITRFFFTQVIFHFMERTLLTDTIVSALLMMIMILAGVIFMKKEGISLSMFPARNKAFYFIATIIFLILLISTPSLTEDRSIFAVSSLIYSVVLIPVFEELSFRGFVWNKLEAKFSSGLTVYAITTLFFALWHLGYIDIILFRISLRADSINNLPFIMLMKSVTGLCFGIVLGAVRYKTKNCFSTILLHGIMNMFGRFRYFWLGQFSFLILRLLEIIPHPFN
ncbi:MAG TPA: CPBP family intramembrane metalloprotease [Atribacterota bacterium]|nr:CPBP family intramembrane metalloprotease [Atribacterota bacterium]HOR43052.1 CPBP family intramembrane metalloprotease [Atribacterota bacterium]